MTVYYDVDVSTLNECADPNRNGAYLIPAGCGVGLNWIVRDSRGRTVQVLQPEDGNAEGSLTNVFGNPELQPQMDLEAEEELTCNSVFAMAAPVFCDRAVPVRLTMAYGVNGELRLILPDSMSQRPGYYVVEARWVDGSSVYENTLLVGIESSLVNRFTGGVARQGPISLRQIRTKIRDFVEINDLSGKFDFTAEEIIEAIVSPITYWNDTPPRISRYTVENFPFHHYWLEAVVAKLYESAALWMMRNDMQLQGEGITSNDKGAQKWSGFLAYSEKSWQQYSLFVFKEKTRENFMNGFMVM